MGNFLRFFLPAISLLSLILCIAGIIPTPIFFGIAFIFFIIIRVYQQKNHADYDKLNKIAPQIETLSDSADWIEAATFNAEILQQLQQHSLPTIKKLLLISNI